MAEWLVSTDLDGTLLNHHSYAFEAVLPVVARLKEAGVPLLLNSSKTLAELRAWRETFHLSDPIIAENGGIVAQSTQSVRYLGTARTHILSLIHAWRAQKGWLFEGFADWTLEQVIEQTGLDPQAAQASMQRDVTEPIIWLGSPPGLVEFQAFLAQNQLQLQKGGRFYHVMAPHDKASALKQLQPDYPNRKILALGDGGNDRAMLAMADIAVVMPNAQGDYLQLEPQNNPQIIYHAPQQAPVGWAQAVSHFIFQEAL
ncbi:HAD-IIB family hydrolase [Thiomicrospira microaerophila]|uniref:HAD-IIB family hydrolase n=1 Tax=Thiomicrospira microaerophila TaxID=406020 RepID=UPI0005C8DF59|nr:HAD-IIB family hydrolase [Thiomicrospira microaerophila]